MSSRPTQNTRGVLGGSRSVTRGRPAGSRAVADHAGRFVDGEVHELRAGRALRHRREFLASADRRAFPVRSPPFGRLRRGLRESTLRIRGGWRCPLAPEPFASRSPPSSVGRSSGDFAAACLHGCAGVRGRAALAESACDGAGLGGCMVSTSKCGADAGTNKSTGEIPHDRRRERRNHRGDERRQWPTNRAAAAAVETRPDCGAAAGYGRRYHRGSVARDRAKRSAVA